MDSHSCIYLSLNYHSAFFFFVKTWERVLYTLLLRNIQYSGFCIKWPRYFEYFNFVKRYLSAKIRIMYKSIQICKSIDWFPYDAGFYWMKLLIRVQFNIHFKQNNFFSEQNTKQLFVAHLILQNTTQRRFRKPNMKQLFIILWNAALFMKNTTSIWFFPLTFFSTARLNKLFSFMRSILTQFCAIA